MSKMGEQLFYDIESLYIDGLSAKRIAAELGCTVEMVLETLEELGVADAPQEEYSPYDTFNS